MPKVVIGQEELRLTISLASLIDELDSKYDYPNYP
jgi:hypothetical protein